MNLLKKASFLGALLLGLLMTQNTYAQKGHRGAGLEKLKVELNLTEQQAADWQAITDKYQTQIQALKKSSTEKGANREEIRSLYQIQRQEVIALLNPEQLAILKAKKEERRAVRKERWKNIDKKAMKAELEAYKEQNITPILLEQRAKLETELSATDKASIANLRNVFAEMKAEKKALRKKYKQEGKRPSREEMQQIKAEMKEKYADEKATLTALAEKYATSLNILKEEIAPQIKQWKKESQEITEKYMSHDEKLNQGDKGEHRGRKGHGGKWGKYLQSKKAIHHFILLDPMQSTVKSTGIATTNISIYPNPAINNSKIDYEVKDAGNIKIELCDENGSVIKVLLNEYKDVGTYTLNASLSNLRDGIYYYILTDTQGIVTKKLALNK